MKVRALVLLAACACACTCGPRGEPCASASGTCATSLSTTLRLRGGGRHATSAGARKREVEQWRETKLRQAAAAKAVNLTEGAIDRAIEQVGGGVRHQQTEKDPAAADRTEKGADEASSDGGGAGSFGQSSSFDLNDLPCDADEALFEAAEEGDTLKMEAAVARGADVDAADPFTEGFTALHLSLLKDNAEGCARLVALGADINRGNKNGETPLHIAALTDSPALCASIVDLGADLSARDQWGKTALTAAQDSGKTLAAAYLRSVGAPSGGEDVLLREHTPMAAAGRTKGREAGGGGVEDLMRQVNEAMVDSASV